MTQIDWTAGQEPLLSGIEALLADGRSWPVERLLADFPDAALRDYEGDTVLRAAAVGMLLIHVQPDRWTDPWTSAIARAYDRGHELRHHTRSVSDISFYEAFVEPIVVLGAMGMRTGRWELVKALLEASVSVSRSNGGTKDAFLAEHVCSVSRSWPERLERAQEALLADVALRPDRPLRRPKLTDFDRALLRHSVDQFVFVAHVFSQAHGRYGVPLLDAYASDGEIIEPAIRSIFSDRALRKTAFADIEQEALLRATFGELERRAFAGSLFNQLEDPVVREHYRAFEEVGGRVLA